jgi:hypothetical protein
MLYVTLGVGSMVVIEHVITLLCNTIFMCTHTHTHTHIYIYIYKKKQIST